MKALLYQVFLAHCAAPNASTHPEDHSHKAQYPDLQRGGLARVVLCWSSSHWHSAGWMGSWPTWPSGQHLHAWQGSWNQMILQVSSNPSLSMIVWLLGSSTEPRAVLDSRAAAVLTAGQWAACFFHPHKSDAVAYIRRISTAIPAGWSDALTGTGNRKYLLVWILNQWA